jgi:DNA-directed RNA polymerase subunit RPC12/RpoP
MTDIVSRLQSIHARLGELRAFLDGAGQPEPAERIRALQDELDGLMRDTGRAAPPPAAISAPAPATAERRRRAASAVQRCPRCSLRSLHRVEGETRPAEAVPGGVDALWRCASCGHEVWIPKA